MKRNSKVLIVIFLFITVINVMSNSKEKTVNTNFTKCSNI